MSGSVSSGQILSGQTIASGSLTVLSGGYAVADTFVDAALEVDSGGSASDLTFMTTSSGDYSAYYGYVLAGGAVDGLVLSGGPGSIIDLLDQGTVTNVTIEADVDFQATTGVAGATVEKNGALYLEGGLGSNITVESGGNLFIRAGSAVDTIVASGGLASGTTAIDTLVEQGGELRVSAGSGTTVASGGLEIVQTSEIGGTVDSGGILVVLPGATTSDLTVQAGGIVVSTGAIVLENDADSGFTPYASGAVVQGITTDDLVEILPSGTVSASDLGGEVDIASGGMLAGGSASDVVYVASGGTISGTTVTDDLFVSSGATAIDVTVTSDARLYLSGGTLEDSTVDGYLDAYKGAVVSDVTFASGATGGSLSATFTDVTVQSGASVTLEGNLTSTVIDGGTVLFGDGTGTGDAVSAGGQFTVQGGTEINGVVGSGGTLTVGLLGVVSNTTVEDGGVEILSNPYYLSGGIDYGGTVESGGQVIVSVGTVVSTTIEAGAVVTIEEGGFASDTVIDGGVLELEAGASLSGSLTFAESGGALDIDDASTFPSSSTAIAGFTSGDSIDFGFLTYSAEDSVTVANGGVAITADGQIYDLALEGASSDTFEIVPTTDNEVELVVVCFYPGTRIRTNNGDVAVQDLGLGDIIITADNRSLPVRWIGRNTVSTRFGDPLRVLPIRIKAGALSAGLPVRDLLVSAEHAILVDDILIQAGALVNNLSILREANVPETFTYYHVELSEHVLLLAEGIAAESFVDNISREAFDNWLERDTLYNSIPIDELNIPRAQSHRQVPVEIHARLLARARGLLTRTPDAAA